MSYVPAVTEKLCSNAGFTAQQAAVLVYTDHMTRSVVVPKNVFDALRAELENDQQMFEVTATVATYNMVSRILMALDVGDKASESIPDVAHE